jgi:hypothetical protein
MYRMEEPEGIRWSLLVLVVCSCLVMILSAIRQLLRVVVTFHLFRDRHLYVHQLTL